ncbi:MAG: tyrosine--tRNA ligase [Elusimicrobia bacterium]|jgi:tyrosyl-tRNA synthetase|nr:tyrosine--tRNA ligase [Elusimicrobiota bacterium]
MEKRNIKKQLDIITRGAEEVIGLKDIKEKLENGKTLTVKFGADPTAPELHLGHTVVMEKLRAFQELDHKVVFIIGDFTARIGDPSGRVKERPVLTEEEISKSVAGYKKQIFKVLAKENIKLVKNSKWLDKLGAEGIIRLASSYTVARMLERNDFSKRYADGNPITITEFIYPLLQGYDSVELNADIEIGGTDQKFNLLVGRELQKNHGQPPQAILTMPLLEGTDGVKKMSKSYKNHIGIDEPPSEIYGKVMSLSDKLMVRYYNLLTNEDIEKINKMHPLKAKKMLAFKLVERYYDKKTAEAAGAGFERIFSKGKEPAEIKNTFKVKEGVKLVNAVCGIFKNYTKSDVKRLIKQGGVTINSKKMTYPGYRFDGNEEGTLKIGKKDFIKLEKS